jgi:C1A family cysteine protease
VSRLFHYYATRKIEGTTNEDSGATIRDAIKAGVSYGVANENMWPYDIAKYRTNPPSAVWADASKHKVTSYHSIADGDLASIKSAIAQGNPVGFGFQVYDYFLTSDMASKGKLCLPKANESLHGGHAVTAVGYDDLVSMPDGSVGAMLIRNSWGSDWGIGGGYFWLSYNYVANTRLCSDFWVVLSSPL